MDDYLEDIKPSLHLRAEFQEDFEDSIPVLPRPAEFQEWFKDSMLNKPTPRINKNIIQWTWHDQNNRNFVDFRNDGQDVIFHRTHSSGTAVVRGTEPMMQDQHFWEILMISPLYGTDVMVGIGTSDANMSQLPNMFISRLGNDNHTWGYSFKGKFYHDKEEKNLPTFNQGSIIGMHLDLWNGTLSFYKNKKHLGVTTAGLQGKTLYAMASSTAAHSSMRILRSCYFPSSLQFLCCVKLRDLIPDDKSALNELPLPPGLKFFLQNNLDWLLNPRLNEELPFKGEKLSKFHNSCDAIDLLVPEPWSSPTRPDERRVNYTVLGEQSIFFRELNYLFQRRNAEHNICESTGSNETLTYQRRNAEHDIHESTGSNETFTSDEVENYSFEDVCDSDDASEANCKKYSYNYTMGLSDPDTDTEL